MAETTKGIYYPNDYASVADIPKDLKEMAESIEKVIENEAYDDTQIQKDISQLKQKNTEQDTTIEELKAENIELKAENERLNNDINAISVTERAEGENITLNDTAEARFKSFGIGGNSWQKTREGYNLIPFTYETKTVNGVTFTVNDDGTIKVDGTATANTYFNLGKPTLPAGDYILTGLPGNGSSTTFKITFKFEDTQQNLFGTDGKTFTINSEATAQENYLFIASGYTASNLVFKPMITKGATVKDYEQYGAMPSTNYKSDIQNVTGNANVTICNKNLIKVNRVGPSGSTYNEKEPSLNNGIVNCKGKNNEAYTSKGLYQNGFVTIYTVINCKPSTKYFISCKIDVISNQKNVDISYFSVFLEGYMQTYLVFNSKTGRYEGSLTTFKKLISDSTDRRYLEIRVDGCEMNISDILISEKEDTTYTEHQSQSFTFPLQEDQRLMLGDYLADDGIHHKRKQVMFDGTENWQDYPTQIEGYYKAFTADIKTNSKFSSATNPLCNYFIAKSVSYVAENNSGIYSSQYATYISISDTVATNVDELKAYLAEQYANGTPVVVEYDLAEEEIDPYTPKQQTVHDEIKKTAHSYGEQTHIFSTDETGPIFNVEARKDMNTVISNLESMIISNASEEV